MDEREPKRRREMRAQGEQLMTKMLTERAIHLGQANCLREIAHNDGVAQRELADILCVSRPTVKGGLS